MLIEKNLTIQMIELDSLDVQPRPDHCDEFIQGGHGWFLTVEAAGFKYKICRRCGTVRIAEMHG